VSGRRLEGCVDYDVNNRFDYAVLLLFVYSVIHHMVECPCLQHVRVRYPQLFSPDMLSAPDAYLD
jgi:hypothetical protein